VTNNNGGVTCLWLSRHEPLLAQRRALERHFPGCEWVMDSDIFVDAADVVKRVEQARNGFEAVHHIDGDPDNNDVSNLRVMTIARPVEVVVVAPLSLIQKLIERGIKPLWPVMREVVSGASSSTISQEKWFQKYGDSEVPRMVLKAAEYYREHTDSCVLAPRGRVLEVVKFRRLVGIHMEFEEL